MPKKSIAIIVCAWPPGGGGIGNTAFYHAKYLNPDKYEVGVFTPKYHDTLSLTESGAKQFAIKPFPAFGKAGFMWSLLWRLKDYDILHLYYPFFGTDWIVLFAKLIYRKKMILHHQMDPIGDGFKKYFFKIYIKLFLGLFVYFSDRVVGLSTDQLEHCYLTKYYRKNPAKFFVVPNMVDAEKFYPQPKDSALMQKLNLKSEDKVLIFVGCLDAHHYFKGVSLIMKAVQLLQGKYPNLKFLVVGDGNRRLQYEQEAKELGIDARVIFAGWVDNVDLPKYYCLADIQVLPSTDSTEAFGGVIAEAQCCGICSIGSNWPGSRMTLADKETGLLVQPGNQDDLTAKIDLLLGDDSLRQQMGEKATLRARHLFSANYAVGELLPQLYESLK
ncbi:MAG: glycosyltransferase family 4 protein [Patescibacteria group bacterium]|jgi:glycosyltransferase involved in cell wall biosynthesis